MTTLNAGEGKVEYSPREFRAACQRVMDEARPRALTIEEIRRRAIDSLTPKDPNQ